MYSTPVAVGFVSIIPPKASLKPLKLETASVPTLPKTLSAPLPKKLPAAFSTLNPILLPKNLVVSPRKLLTAPVTVL